MSMTVAKKTETTLDRINSGTISAYHSAAGNGWERETEREGEGDSGMVVNKQIDTRKTPSQVVMSP